MGPHNKTGGVSFGAGLEYIHIFLFPVCESSKFLFPLCMVPDYRHSYWLERLPGEWMTVYTRVICYGHHTLVTCLWQIGKCFCWIFLLCSSTEWLGLEVTIKITQFQPLLWAGCPSPAQAAQGPPSLALSTFKGGVPTALWAAVPPSHQPLKRKIPPSTSSQSLLFYGHCSLSYHYWIMKTLLLVSSPQVQEVSMRSPQNLLQSERAQLSQLFFVREMLQPHVHSCGSPGPTPTALYPYCTAGPQAWTQTWSSWWSFTKAEQSVGQSCLSSCCSPLCWCSAGYWWHSGMQTHTVGLHQDFSCPTGQLSGLLSMSFSPSLYSSLGLLWFKCNTLHLALSDLIMFTWACFLSLSRSLWMPSLPSVMSTAPLHLDPWWTYWGCPWSHCLGHW